MLLLYSIARSTAVSRRKDQSPWDHLPVGPTSRVLEYFWNRTHFVYPDEILSWDRPRLLWETETTIKATEIGRPSQNTSQATARNVTSFYKAAWKTFFVWRELLMAWKACVQIQNLLKSQCMSQQHNTSPTYRTTVSIGVLAHTS